jgi:hypothetical protein
MKVYPRIPPKIIHSSTTHLLKSSPPSLKAQSTQPSATFPRSIYTNQPTNNTPTTAPGSSQNGGGSSIQTNRGARHQSPLQAPREVNHTMEWAPQHQQYSPPYPSHFPPQADRNNQAQASAYYQSYHYHNQSSTTFANSRNNISSSSATKSHTQCQTTPMLKSRPKPTLRHHLHHKSKSLRNNPTLSLPTTQSSQSPEVLTLIYQEIVQRLLPASQSCSCRMPHYPNQMVPYAYHLLKPRCEPSFISPY